jgi:hypothetical protein
MMNDAHALTTMAVLASLWFAQPIAHAQSANERTWAKAKEALLAAQNLVADTVNTDIEMFDGGGNSMGTMSIREKISGWADGEPVRAIIASSNPEHTAVAKSRFKAIVDNHPEKSLRDGATLERVESAVYEGKPCGLYLATGTNGKVSFRSKIWIEESTGLPLKVVHDFEGFPMTKAMEHSITYGRSKEGAWVPESAVVDATVSLLLQKVRIISKYRFLSWVKRPAQS